MKKLFAIALLMTVPVFAGDQHKHDHGNDTKEAKAEHHACKPEEGQACTMIKVPTAQCDNCANIIETALNEVEGVTMAKVNLDNKVTHIHYESDQVQVLDLEKAIVAAGYDANDVERDEKAHAELPKCCQSAK